VDRTEAEAFPQGACFQCHEKNAAVEHSFVQFYPQLLDVALRKGTIKPGVEIPLNANGLYDAILEKGWKPAEEAYFAEKKKNPQSDLLQEHTLSMVGESLFEKKKTAEAVALFELVAREHPKSATAYATLGEAYAQTKQRQAAIDATNKSLALAEKDPALSDSDKQQLREGAQRRLQQLNK
jgi:tetratricopeptide (TPR) repeat protein